ncbi:hypothetical protein [Curvivirga sp.]|uniref:hypothetical protein n=1 Tax=Curvivirga sp. TaxID=2856848 RepID=UPI003B594CCA
MTYETQNLNVKQLVKIVVVALIAISVSGFLIGHMIGTIWTINISSMEQALFSFVELFEAETIQQLALIAG